MKRKILVFFLMAIFSLTSFVFSVSVDADKTKEDEKSKYRDDFNNQLQILNYAFTLIYKNYYEKIPAQLLVYKMLKGLGKELDPFTHFEEPKADKDIKMQLKGQYGGLGFIVSQKGGWIVVVSPFEGTPAHRAGLKPGDIIVQIDDKKTHNMDLQKAVDLMRGKPGTKVKLTIKREGVEKLIIKELTREIIKLPTVKKYYFPKEKIGYVRIVQFNATAGDDTRKAFEDLKKEHPDLKGLILDLRHNPGGFLKGAVKVASIFLPLGKLVVYTKGRIPTANESYLVKEQPVFPKKPLVVLVDRGSASASEIVTGALKDWKRAVVVGRKTFGKGSVQNIFNLPDGSALYLTVAHYYTPHGVCINEKGIEPDVDVDYKLLTKEEDKKKTDEKKDKEEKKLEKEIEEALDKMENKKRTSTQEAESQKKPATVEVETKESPATGEAEAKPKEPTETKSQPKTDEKEKNEKKKDTKNAEDINKPLLDTQLKTALDILKALSILQKQ